ncbi:hypothetical protein EDB85DRAFT_1890335 [Lactarius pseudohatsudake]|nr:hypothetical protein EDB85DRAFT_1890335 [Lactarius pseudohatsudake]
MCRNGMGLGHQSARSGVRNGWVREGVRSRGKEINGPDHDNDCDHVTHGQILSIVNTAVMSLTSNVQLVGFDPEIQISNSLRFTRRATTTPRQPTQPASSPASLRRQHGSAQTLPCTTAPTKRHASPAMSPRHRRGLQSLPRRYDANTAACKSRRVTATPTRWNAGPAMSPRHRHSGMQAPACHHDTDAACKPRHIATTLTRQHASPAVSPQH